MDQPTYLNIVIRGTETDVKKAALAAMRRVNLETRGFNESLYAWADGMDFHERMDQIFVVLGKYDLRQIDDHTFEFTSMQDSYACFYQEDITSIAEAILAVTPDLEFHIVAEITITAFDGFYTDVMIDYVDGELKTDVQEMYFDDYDEECE